MGTRNAALGKYANKAPDLHLPVAKGERRAYFVLTFFLRLFFLVLSPELPRISTKKSSFRVELLQIFTKHCVFSVKLLQISIKNPLKLVFSSNEEGRKEGRKEERNPPVVFERHRLAIAHLDIIS